MAPKILIVDDNAELVGLLSGVFEEAGYAVVSAQRAKAAAELAFKERPAFALVDILLPDTMGYEVGKSLTKLNIPYAYMTGVFRGGRHALEARQFHGAVNYF